MLSLDLEQERQAVRAFFTQEVVLRKWSPLHWLFIRRSIERVLHDDHEGDRSNELLELLDLFNVITQKGSGLAAMDFGYAFDSLIWVSCNIFLNFMQALVNLKFTKIKTQLR